MSSYEVSEQSVRNISNESVRNHWVNRRAVVEQISLESWNIPCNFIRLASLTLPRHYTHYTPRKPFICSSSGVTNENRTTKHEEIWSLGIFSSHNTPHLVTWKTFLTLLYKWLFSQSRTFSMECFVWNEVNFIFRQSRNKWTIIHWCRTIIYCTNWTTPCWH